MQAGALCGSARAWCGVLLQVFALTKERDALKRAAAAGAAASGGDAATEAAALNRQLHKKDELVSQVRGVWAKHWSCSVCKEAEHPISHEVQRCSSTAHILSQLSPLLVAWLCAPACAASELR